MARRVVSVLFLVCVMAIASSGFYNYLTYKADIKEVPLKYDNVQKEQQAEWLAEDDRVLAVNRKIMDEVLQKFTNLGGDVSSLSRFDSVRFMNGLETSSQLLNSIEHEELAVNKVPDPMTDQEKLNRVAEELRSLKDNLKTKLIIHSYAFVMAFILFIILIILFKPKLKKESS